MFVMLEDNPQREDSNNYQDSRNAYEKCRVNRDLVNLNCVRLAIECFGDLQRSIRVEISLDAKPDPPTPGSTSSLHYAE